MSVSLDNCEFKADLVILLMRDVDVILGMDWLSPSNVHIDFYNKTVTFELLGQ